MKNIKSLFTIIFLVAVTWIFSAAFSDYKWNDTHYLVVTLGGQKIKAEVALSPKAKAKGLSGRSGLKENEGMFFPFEYPDKYSFWMKDMKFPVDIIWISKDRKVIYIKKNAKPEDFPASYTPEEKALFVLGVVAGFSDKNNLKEGDSVSFWD